jgi:hypothetical protein
MNPPRLFVGFGHLPHFEKIDGLQSACTFFEYSCKAEPYPDFAKHWKALLLQPSTFSPRITQMKRFRVCRSTGLFRVIRTA